MAAMDANGAAGLYANRVTRMEISPLRMTGNYGGEILRGMVGLNPSQTANPFFDQGFAARIRGGH